MLRHLPTYDGTSSAFPKIVNPTIFALTSKFLKDFVRIFFASTKLEHLRLSTEAPLF